MEELVKNIFLAGVGTLAITYDKSKEIVDELISAGKISVQQGKVLNAELKKTIENEIKNEEVDYSNLATKKDIEEILNRLDKLENKDE